MPADAWPFPSPRDTRTFTLRSIGEHEAPVLYAVHDDGDGCWQFTDGEEPEEDDVILVCLEHVIESDPSLVELADLPRGWHAWRDTPLDPWEREPIPPDQLQ